MINETLNKSAELIQAQSSSYIPSLITQWIAFSIILIAITALFKSEKTNWGRFWGVWFFVTLITGIITILLTTSPNFIVDTIQLIKEFLA